MNAKRTRRDSGVSWLGDLPDTWSAVPLKHRTSLVSRGRSPDYSEDEQGVPIINQACVYWDGIRYDNVKWQRQSTLSGERGRVRRGDLLMNSTGTGTLGRVAVFDRADEYLADSHVTVIRATKDAVPSFLRYVLQTGIYQGYVYSVLAPGATNQIELSREGLRRTPFPMPPVDEQGAIAAFLDLKTAAIESLIAKKERLIELLQEKRQALITQLVTRGLDPKAPMKDSGVGWIGHVPHHWRVLPMRRVVAHQLAGPYGSSLTKAMYSTSGFRVYGQQQVIPNDFATGDYYISHEKFAEMSKYEVHPGDLLVTVMGTIGRVAVVPKGVERGIMNPRLVRYVISERHASPHYIAWVLRSNVGAAQLAEAAQGSTMDGLNLRIIGTVMLALPPRAEQDEIVTRIDAVDAWSSRLTKHVQNQLERLREYRQALITAAVTGKIDVSEEAA